MVLSRALALVCRGNNTETHPKGRIQMTKLINNHVNKTRTKIVGRLKVKTVFETTSAYVWVQRSQMSEVAGFQHLFPNPSWLTSGRTSDHQNIVSIFPEIDNCHKAKC